MRAYVSRETLYPCPPPPLSIISKVYLELTEEEAGKLKMLANYLSTTVRLTDNRAGAIVKFQSYLWDELDSRGIEAYEGTKGSNGRQEIQD